jgi:acyl-coenzyme A thioesterase PaaI-like protein
MANGRRPEEAEDSPRQWCFGCGTRNEEGLHIDFEVDGLNVTGRFTPRKAHQGFPGVAHGGIAAAALDEAMGWAMYAANAWAMTARMEVRYRSPLPLNEPVVVTARVTRDRGRRLEAEAQIATAGGHVLAQADALFLRMPEERSRQFNESFLGTA